MAKEKTLFACTACGYETSRWVGRCPGCGAWNTMVESAPIVTGAPAKAPKQRPGTGASAMLLREIPEDVAVRSSTGISELDRVLGGGIVEGALMLIGGDPGIGKSTLLLQVCANLCKTGKRVLYVSGEESAKQLKLRANRLGITSETLYVLAENALDNVEEKLRGLSPDVAVIDSIQTMYRPDMASAPGSVQGERHGNFPCRACDEGRRDCRPANAGTHGGRRAVLRGRPSAGISAAARGQKPLRIGQ